MITDRLQATANYGVKHVSTEIGGQKLKSWNHLLGGEARFDVTEKIDIGLRGSYLTSDGTNSAQYSFGPSIGVSPVKNIWVSAGYNVQGFKDDDFEAAEYSRKGAYLQMRLKFDQNTARGLLRRISPSQAGSNTPQQQVYNVKQDKAALALAPQPKRSLLCSDGLTEVFDLGTCPVVSTPVLVVQSETGVESPVENKSRKLSQLGPMPEFGDSHGLNAVQFYHKLKNRFKSSETDRAHLDQLFISMGYENGFADAQSYMFSEEILPEGVNGFLGFVKDNEANDPALMLSLIHI